MKKKRFMKKASVLAVSFALLTSSVAFGHSGRTDSSGGHRDNKNVSGLGYYHYHCGGNPAHLHPNGRCPYSGSSTPSTSGGSNATSPVKISAKVPNTSVKIDGVNINTANAKYPPLLFKDITYIPITFDIVYYLDINYNWTDASNLKFSRTIGLKNTKQFKQMFTDGSSWSGMSAYATKVNKGIIVNNLWVNNTYPIINYKNINYIPLTYDFVTNLGLSYTWDPVNGFNLISK
ncbi:hypothetical protein EUAN_22650 [Andreesenia angusta]|uniref:YHYH domain-containing protein n=1 Tax=Andreesenia angusta TaxID=39480 RepID=A0A1S1V4Q9_9FIRM|nr:YHYH domain-containing protein [Andreesenia angusta]OHW61415.1 hypothetical protein EUAN_22650 [Andreesenia angusta]